jgi:hypothetical protein
MNRNGRLNPGCGQRRFSSQLAAEKALAKALLLPGNADDDRSVKPCKTRGCGGWHLSESDHETGFSATVRLAVRKRAGGGDVNDARCESCNIWLGRYGGQVQHIVARMIGGSRKRNGITNGCLLCGNSLTGCHGLCEARSEHMRARGFWRKSSDPVIPLMLHGEQSGVLVHLTPEGGYEVARPGEEAA